MGKRLAGWHSQRVVVNVLHPVGGQHCWGFPRLIQHWNQCCLIPLSMTWMRGSSAPSGSSQTALSWVRVLGCAEDSQ